MEGKNKKKPPTEVDDLYNCKDIITDYLKFVKPPVKGAVEVLEQIENKEVLLKVLEYIACRAENKCKMSSRMVKQFVNNLNNICDLQKIDDSDRYDVQIMMLSKAISGCWRAVYALKPCEIELIHEHNKNNESSFSMDVIKAKVNNFD